MDLEQIDSGRVVYRNDIRVAFMEQTENMDESQTILESIFDHDLPELKALKKYNEALIDNDQDKLNECYEELTELNAWDYEVRVNQILSVLKLTDSKRLIGSLSGGQKKRIGVARTLVLNPEIMLYDEPTAGLDPITCVDINNLINEVRERYKTSSIVITHDLACAKQTGDRMAVLLDGQFGALGTFEEVFPHAEDQRIKSFYDYNFINS